MLKYLFFGLIFLFFSSSKIDAQNLASNLMNIDICVGKTKTIDCTTSIKNTQSIVISESFYGVQKSGTSVCGYNAGDCTQDLTINVCGYNKTVCDLQATTRTLSKCSKSANYLRLNYYCVPYEHPTVNTLDICSGVSEITSNNGFIVSPGYPNFQTQSQTCTIKIKVPFGKSINIWAVDMSLKGRGSSGDCLTSFVKITDNTGTYDLCGTERLALTEELCSNEVYISYQGADPANNNRGFKLFYETYDVSQTSCSTQAPEFPSIATGSTTTPTLTNGQASLIFNFRLCTSDPALTIRAPNSNYLVFIESLTYGVPSTQACELYSQSHCLTPAPITCNAKSSCTFRLGNVSISSCGNLQAQYLYGTYRFIPIQSTVKYKMCNTTEINADLVNYGILTNKNYPYWSQNENCTLTIKSTIPNKSIRIYVTDINIEPDDSFYNPNCEIEKLEFSDGITTDKHCGELSDLDTLTYTTCTNSLTINYLTSKYLFGTYYFDGFRTYYEIVDRPSNCENTINTIPTTPASFSTTTTGKTDPVNSHVLAIDSNGNYQYCVFPFKYKDQIYESCINQDQSDYWCSLTDNFDRDNRRGKCSLGITSLTQLEICTNDYRRFNCPSGYVIRVLTGEYVATTDASCNYNNRKCSASAIRSSSFTCNGYRYCDLYSAPFRISTCSNTLSNLVHIDYTCLPSSVPMIPVFEFCRTNTLTSDYGFIQTPSYPSLQVNLNCSMRYTSNVRKHITVYAIKVILESAISGQECLNYWVQVNDGNKYCGIETSALIYEGCTTDFEARILIGTRSYNGTKLFYEVRDIKDESYCPVTTMSTVSSLSTVTTKPGIQPIWAQQGISSPLSTLNMCLTGKTIECPSNYTISIRRAFYGISNNQDCFYSRLDCVSYAAIDGLECAGRQTCFAPYSTKKLPECSYRSSNYIQIEYDCIPDNYPKTSFCGANLNGQSNGGLINPNYPNFDTNLNCISNIRVSTNSIIKVYLKDLDIEEHEDCAIESITISSSNSVSRTLCGDLKSYFVLETCSNELNITLKTGADAGIKRGVSLYYEAIPKPFDLDCGDKPKTTTVSTTTQTTTKLTTTTTKPSYYGFASPEILEIGCAKKSIYCPDGFIIAIESSYYAVKKNFDNFCSYDPSDCFANFQKPFTLCAGTQNCSIPFDTFTSIAECGRNYASYFAVTYQCIPTTNAGNPIQPNVDLCSPFSSSTSYSVAPKSSAIFQSYNFPTYPNVSVNCSVKINIQDGYNLNVFLNTARFRGSVTPNCSKNTDFVVITDGFETFKFCNNPQEGVFLMQSRSNWIQIDYSVTALTFVAPFYKGFQIYVESYMSQIEPVTPVDPISPPIIAYDLGFASQNVHDELCSRSSKVLTCPDDYIAIFHSEFLVETNGKGCNHDSNECKQPHELVTNECSGKQTCNIYFPETPILRCNSKFADLLDLEYQCIPSKSLIEETKVYTCNDKSVINVRNGFVQSPNYPEQTADYDCDFKITPPMNYGLKFYIIDLSLKNSNPDSCDMNYVSIEDVKLCTSAKSQFIFYSNDSNTLSVKFRGLKSQEARGFNFYFEAYSLQETTLRPTTISNFFIQATSIKNTENSSNLLNVSLGLGIPALVILIALILYFLWRNNSNDFGGFQTRIKFDPKDNNNLSSFANPNLE